MNQIGLLLASLIQEEGWVSLSQSLLTTILESSKKLNTWHDELEQKDIWGNTEIRKSISEFFLSLNLNKHK